MARAGRRRFRWDSQLYAVVLSVWMFIKAAAPAYEKAEFNYTVIGIICGSISADS